MTLLKNNRISAGLILKIHTGKISDQKIKTVVDVLKKGGIIVFPTDTVYAFGCDLFQPRAIARLIKISGKKRPDFSFLCCDIAQATKYTASLDTPVFKMMKNLFPGPYTIIVNASAQVSRLFKTNKKTVGIRIPANEITRAISRSLGNPIISTSLHDEDVIMDYMTDPQDIQTRLRSEVDLIIDGGTGGNLPSTVIDYTQSEPTLIRQGAGEWES